MVGREEVIRRAVVVHEHGLVTALVSVRAKRLQELVWSCHLIRNCDTDARLLVALVLELKMEEHHVCAGLGVAHHLRPLDDAPRLDIMSDFIGN